MMMIVLKCLLLIQFALLANADYAVRRVRVGTKPTTEAPVTTAPPEVPEIPEKPETLPATEPPVTTDPPEVPDIPEIPETLPTTESPVATDPPEVPEIPEIPETLPATEPPVATDPPEVPEIPEIPETVPETEPVTEMPTMIMDNITMMENMTDMPTEMATDMPTEMATDMPTDMTTTGTATEPPVTEPPATEPPATAPPTTKLPGTEPPTTPQRTCAVEEDALRQCYDTIGDASSTCDACVASKIPSSVASCEQLSALICDAISTCECGDCDVPLEKYLDCAFTTAVGCPISCTAP